MLRSLDEFCALSTSEYLLIGGDEWQTPSWQLADPGLSPARLWAEFMNLAVKHLIAMGRKPIVWHDMLFHYPEALDLLSRQAVVAFWYYNDDSDFPALQMLKDRQFETLMASGCIGHLDGRYLSALRQGWQAAQDYAAAGFMMTSWCDTRWESPKALMTLTADFIAGRESPATVLEASSLFGLCERVAEKPELDQNLRERLLDVLKDPDWHNFPEYRNELLAFATRDRDRDIELFTRFQFPAGPHFERIAHPQPSALSPSQVEGVNRLEQGNEGFSLEITTCELKGDVLRVRNGEEAFSLYPKYGGTLQGWSFQDVTLVPHKFPISLRKNAPLPGGFKSYIGVGGFRPVWAFGTHQVPCILWQFPFAWTVEKNTDEEIVVSLRRAFPQVDISYQIYVRRGIPGFVYGVEAVNKWEDAFGAINFNLPLAITSWEETSLKWLDGEKVHQKTFAEFSASGFWLPCGNQLELKSGNWKLGIRAREGEYAGCYVDWDCAWGMTPDLRGVYRKLARQESLRAQWEFSPQGLVGR